MDPLPAVPASLTETRTALHRLAAYVIAPTRHRATGRFGLRATPGGFGTPEFDGRRVRVEGLELIDEVDGSERRHQISSLQAAADFLGGPIDPDTAAEHDSPALGDVEADLSIDGQASGLLGQWFDLAFEALRTVAADDASVDASEPQLWPGHFDPAIEVGDEDHRGSYGASPGDHSIDEPYLYLSIWYPDRIGVDPADDIWNAPAFTGSMLKLSDFPAGADPVAVAVNFWRTSRDALS
ncbi:MAG: hypothetical protein R8J94_17155 [Acidimicrobiia bacterium]|nr:hypothetical protein [Acidimicrobiia bacterium]